MILPALCRSTILRLNHWTNGKLYIRQKFEVKFLGKWIKQSNTVYFEFVIANYTEFVNNNFVDTFKKLLSDPINWFWHSKLQILNFIALASSQTTSCLHVNFAIKTRVTREIPHDMRIWKIVGDCIGDSIPVVFSSIDHANMI